MFMSDLTVPLDSTLPVPLTKAPLHGRRLVVGRVIWAVITILLIGLVVLGIPVRYQKVITADPTIRAPEFRNLIEVGVPAEIVASLDVANGALLTLVLMGGGMLLFRVRSDSRETISLSLALI